MKYGQVFNLYVLFAVAAVLAAGGANAAESSAPLPSDRGRFEMSQVAPAAAEQPDQSVSETEVNAFATSEYTYWDAVQLADYWGQSLIDAKARIGRKVLWGPADVAILEQFLLDARLASLRTLDETESLRLYIESNYTYDDAVALAEFWGESDPFEAKLRIERNLILGNEDEVYNALYLATQ